MSIIHHTPYIFNTGMDMRNVRFLWASDEINAHADEYWSLVMDIARLNSLPRIQRCCTIMGKLKWNVCGAVVCVPRVYGLCMVHNQH